LSIAKPRTGLRTIGRILCAVERYPATSSVYPFRNMISAELVLNPPAAPLCSNCVAGSIRYAQGKVNKSFQEKLRLVTRCFSVIATSRPGVSLYFVGTASRSKQTYEMFMANESPQKKTGIQKVHPYQPVRSRIGMATIPETRLTVPETALSSPNANASPEAPNQ
jgi:hypothetical protein